MNDSRTRNAIRHLSRANELLRNESSLGFGSLEFVKEFVMNGKHAQKGKGVKMTLVPHKKLPQKQVVCTVTSFEASDKNMSNHLVEMTFKYDGEKNGEHNWSLVVDVGKGWYCDEGPFSGYTWTSSKGFKDLYKAKVEINPTPDIKKFDKYMIRRKEKYMEWERVEEVDIDDSTQALGTRKEQKKDMVMVSHDKGESWVNEQADSNLIVVIGPGAGTFKNALVYKNLEEAGYKILKLKGMGRYPDRWSDNKKLNIDKENNNLAALAKEYPRLVGKKFPHLIICGSRGCQVTIGKIWKHFWRGPTVLINGGCLMTQTPIPVGVFPTAVTMTRDYFETKSDEITKAYFEENSSEEGILVRLNDSHLPTKSLPSVIVPIVQLTGRRELDKKEWESQVRAENIDVLKPR